MRHRRYWMAHNCPQCGAKDAEDEWGGARMGSTSWNHDFMCCSEACGQAFAKTHAEKVKTKAGRKELAKLWEDLASQSDARLCGEPYYGYNAEQLLKHRRF